MKIISTNPAHHASTDIAAPTGLRVQLAEVERLRAVVADIMAKALLARTVR